MFTPVSVRGDDSRSVVLPPRRQSSGPWHWPDTIGVGESDPTSIGGSLTI